MFNLKSRFSNRFIGFDVSKTAIKALVVRKINHKYLIEEIFQLEIKNDLLSALKKIRREMKAKYCAITLPHSSIRISSHYFPINLSNDEIYNSIDLNSRTHLSHPNCEVTFDFEKLPCDLKEQTHIRVVTVKSAELNQCIRLYRTAGFHIKIIDVDSLVIERVFRSYYQNTTDVAILFFNEDHTLFIVLKNKHMVYAQVMERQIAVEVSTVLQRFLRMMRERQGFAIAKIIIVGEADFTEIKQSVQFNNAKLEILDLHDLLAKDSRLIPAYSHLKDLTSSFFICYGVVMRMVV